MILTRKSTDKLTELITSAMAKNEEGKKGAIVTTRLYEGSEKSTDQQITTSSGTTNIITKEVKSEFKNETGGHTPRFL
jgi:hypothetical protein